MPDRDALQDLNKANPRHSPGFDAAVGALSKRTRHTVAAAAAAAAAGVPGGSVPSGWARFRGGLRGGPIGRSRQLWAGVVGAGALLIVLALIATGIVPAPGSGPSTLARQASTSRHAGTRGRPGAAGTTVPAVPGTGGSGAVPSGTTDTAVPTTPVASTPAPGTAAPNTAAVGGPADAAPSSGPGGGTPNGGTKVPTTTGTTAPRTSTTRAPTPPTSPAPIAAPTCVVAISQPPAYQSVLVQDSVSGLASITNVAITNGAVHVPGFAAGTKAAVLVVATKTDLTKPTEWSFDVTNVAGRTTHCV
ncbi:MAG: hypothetical protein QOF20_1970 [Acidimicrobiaceae bacterium]|jgi:hypothetical protein|nr:hypothetical protein [Acidimicrobiaceae bacterium]MDQ1369617.1 hypothetical protein [Acidimicrobiaceae bacterium]